uniref:protein NONRESPONDING TO OXYLIPINS 2, mitochondrial isoform X3 n=1 Tax=Erigeron canadensis TaxID=72917 RepID=UPI001CB90365|nr:protein NONRESPONDING TO OXYLIPINS 2, mitochondrial isoform X3 [Erigeron canadensis]
MASASRSAIGSISRTISSKSNPISRTLLTPKSTPISPFSSSSSTRSLPRAASRVVAALGSVESMLPLHSAIASARLKSSIAVDSTCWSWLSQDLMTEKPWGHTST